MIKKLDHFHIELIQRPWNPVPGFDKPSNELIWEATITYSDGAFLGAVLGGSLGEVCENAQKRIIAEIDLVKILRGE